MITKRRLAKILAECYENNDTDGAKNLKDFYYCSGNANALNYIAYKCKIDLTGIIRKNKNRRGRMKCD